ncbi:hypothetical protein BJ165DRAFT_1530539 [Panaeolus papilionaceus]|nr:hypothetical protein BJ165DRAFT_1530539 [Panaeolus papilionaceus]
MTLDTVDFGPEHENYRRSPWPSDWESIQFQFPLEFIQMLAHNQPPSDAERLAINSFKCLSARAVEKRARKIEELELELRQLEAEKAYFERQKFACEVILSPFRRLSDDILYRIATTVPPQAYKLAYFTRHPFHTPSSLSITCQSWRRVVLGTSGLWRDLAIDVSLWSDFRNKIQEVTHRFQRLSGIYPMSIELIGDKTNQYDNRDPDDCLEWILGSWDGADRLTTLNLSFSHHQEVTHILRLLERFEALATKGVSLPSLDSLILALSPSPMPEEIGVRQLTRLFELQSGLQRLWLGTGTCSWPQYLASKSLINNFQKLTALHIGYAMTSPQLHGLLQVCSQLQTFGFAFTHDQEHDWVEGKEPYTHSTLKTLYTKQLNYSLKNAEWKLHFPSLDTFILHCAQITYPAALSCQLNAIWDMPSMTSLSLTGLCPSYLLLTLNRLRERRDGNLPLPNLIHLKFELPVLARGNSSWDVSAIAEVLVDIWDSRRKESKSSAHPASDEAPYTISRALFTPLVSICYPRAHPSSHFEHHAAEEELGRLEDILSRSGYGRNVEVKINKEAPSKETYDWHEREFMEEYFS